MESFDNILVCVKRPEEMGGLLAHVRNLCSTCSRRIHLLHVATDAPPARSAVTPSPQANTLTIDRLQAIAGEHMMKDGHEEITCKVETGSPLLEILRYAMEKDIDLIVLGRTPETEDHDARLARRLTTKATCSVLVVPENAKCATGRVLVPVRNSECSARALETGCAIATPGQGKVCCLNVFPIRGEYLEADLTLEEHTTLMRQWAERENQQLLEVLPRARRRL